MTPRLFRALYDRREQAQQHYDWVSGVIASAIANFSANPPKKSLEPQDFGLGPKLSRRATTSGTPDGPAAVHERVNRWRAFVNVPLLPLVNPGALNAE